MKGTEQRTPAIQGHLLLSHIAVCKSNSILKSLSVRADSWLPVVSAVERFHCMVRAEDISPYGTQLLS